MPIRRMTASDVAAVHRISTQSFAGPWSKEAIEAELQNSAASYWVAEEDQEILGFIGIWCVLDEANIINVAVDPSQRRKGIAQRLMDVLWMSLPTEGIRTVFLEVRLSNDPARAFYEKNGFSIIGRRKGFYFDGEDALLMSRDL
ncbi:Ribosomal-protein-S18p-alanine acetyltransferase [Clostridiaceae bacterium JG1575]|nr:Ribosomal-protein-S18p-alanine acetyltransferase [Clostridiaceae bacterium JG1575]